MNGLTIAAVALTGLLAFGGGKASQNNDLLGKYVNSVVQDSNKLAGDMSEVVNKYVDETIKSAEDLAQGKKTGEQFADEMEKTSEKLADDLEKIGNSYGDRQEQAGDDFGEKFDKDTAKSVVNVVTNVFKRFR